MSHRIPAFCLLLSLLPATALHAASKGPDPENIQKVYAYEPIAREAFAAAQNFVVTVYGQRARQLFEALAPSGFNPTLTLHGDGVDCYAAFANSGERQEACHLIFKPDVNDFTVQAGDSTFTLRPVFQNDKLEKITIETQAAPPLLDRSCFNLREGAMFIRGIECSYQYNLSPTPVEFPDSWDWQGVAVGWGIFTPEGERLL